MSSVEGIESLLGVAVSVLHKFKDLSRGTLPFVGCGTVDISVGVDSERAVKLGIRPGRWIRVQGIESIVLCDNTLRREQRSTGEGKQRKKTRPGRRRRSGAEKASRHRP